MSFFFSADLVFQNCCASGSDNNENRQQSALGMTGVTCQEKNQNCFGLNPFPFETKTSEKSEKFSSDENEKKGSPTKLQQTLRT